MHIAVSDDSLRQVHSFLKMEYRLPNVHKNVHSSCFIGKSSIAMADLYSPVLFF